MKFFLNFSWFFLTRILSCFVLSWDFWKTNFLDLSRTEIFDYLKFLSCLARKMIVLIISCLEFQDFVSVSNCLVSRKTCLDPPLVFRLEEERATARLARARKFWKIILLGLLVLGNFCRDFGSARSSSIIWTGLARIVFEPKTSLFQAGYVQNEITTILA